MVGLDLGAGGGIHEKILTMDMPMIGKVLEMDSFELIKGGEGDSSGNTLRYCLDRSVG